MTTAADLVISNFQSLKWDRMTLMYVCRQRASGCIFFVCVKGVAAYVWNNWR
jgi:hypothetical protein